MEYLKNRILLILFCIFASGCLSTKAFDIRTEHIEGLNFQIIDVASNRVRQECIFLDAEAENNWRHQYLMFVLNDRNQVLEIAYDINMDKESCREQIAEVQKILKTDPYVKLCARDELKEKTSEKGSWEDKVEFRSFGVHQVHFESLTFDSICNSKTCYGDNSAWTYTCPGFPKNAVK